mmetsp:Transcript_4482/g.10906  ORF Transcript_4482/g.10906 Transcript_4482/m.10906 type:complete len:278 (-) Transcript_4482:132-965(-)
MFFPEGAVLAAAATVAARPGRRGHLRSRHAPPRSLLGREGGLPPVVPGPLLACRVGDVDKGAPTRSLMVGTPLVFAGPVRAVVHDTDHSLRADRNPFSESRVQHAPLRNLDDAVRVPYDVVLQAEPERHSADSRLEGREVSALGGCEEKLGHALAWKVVVRGVELQQGNRGVGDPVGQRVGGAHAEGVPEELEDADADAKLVEEAQQRVHPAVGEAVLRKVHLPHDDGPALPEGRPLLLGERWDLLAGPGAPLLDPMVVEPLFVHPDLQVFVVPCED